MQPGRCKILWNEASPLKYSSCSHIHACNPERNHKLGRSTCDMFLSTAPWFWFHSFPTAAWWNKGLLPRRTRSCLEQCGFLEEAGCGRAAIAFWNKMEPQSLWWHRRISFERWEDHKHIYIQIPEWFGVIATCCRRLEENWFWSTCALVAARCRIAMGIWMIRSSEILILTVLDSSIKYLHQ